MIIKDETVKANPKLAELFGNKEYTNKNLSCKDFIENVTKQKVIFKSRDSLTSICKAKACEERNWDHDCGERSSYLTPTSLFMQSAHNAFSYHIPFGISPEVVWYMILHEIALHVESNSEECRGLFTTVKKQTVLTIISDEFYKDNPNWVELLPKFESLLKAEIPENTLSTMLPGLSTLTPESTTALLVTFMGVAKAYYKYEGGTLCGIPEFNLEGTKDDWNSILTRLGSLKVMFPKLDGYLTSLEFVISHFVKAFNGSVDLKFWRSFYKYDNGSGGPTITGWVNAFFAHKLNDPTNKWAKNQTDLYIPIDRHWLNDGGPNDYSGHMDKYPAHVSKVPFTWKRDTVIHKELTLVSGILGVEFVGNFLTPQLGYAIVE